MFGFWKRIRGRATAQTNAPAEPFPESWQTILHKQVPFFRGLPTDKDRSNLERDVLQFVKSKLWTPFDVDIDDRKKVIIAAFACLLINRRPDLGVYPRTREIIVRPTAFPDVFERLAEDGSIVETGRVFIGEAHYRGPIVLAWNAVEPLTKGRPVGHNVIYHEFAHALDYLDGLADGTPPLDAAAVAEWADEFSDAYDELLATLAKGRGSTIDPYAATDPAEFFAVVTESFFADPKRLKRKHPSLYRQLSEVYRQDPAAWPPPARSSR